MGMLTDNKVQVMGLFKNRGDNFPLGVKDFAGWALVVGILLSIGAWRLGWVANVVSGLLSILFIMGCVCAFLAYPISQFKFRKEPRPTSEYDRVRRESGNR